MKNRFRFLGRLGGVALALGLLFALGYSTFNVFAAPQTSPDRLWQAVSESTLQGTGERWVVPTQYRTLGADEAALAKVLAQAPLEGSAAQGVELTLPLPDGTFERFQVFNSPVMAPELAARYPQITTYRAIGLDDPHAVARLDHTIFGFHGMILSPNGTVFIDPYRRGDTQHYVSYYKSDFVPPAGETFVELGPLGDSQKIRQRVEAMGEATSGPQLRTYRLAIGATGEYTQYYGGTVAGGMAGIVTSVNRVTGVYEKEVAVKLVLIANNDLIVYTNAATDPYTNDDGFTMLDENQATVDAVIGNANYDVGHVFSTGGGGVAYLGVPCQTGMKAMGVTGSPAPVGDPYDIDYVAHEMGHQFGANHTFNSVTGSCGGGNRNGSTAYEPGSATTIMGYAGICGADDIQPHSDDDFHTISFDEIEAYITSDGNSCAVITNTGNHPPVVEAGTGGFTIPKNTPFTLTGSATDPDGDPLTYDWEEFDLGPAGAPNSPSGNAPIFRSFLAVTIPSRTFPKMADIVNNTQVKGEILPSYARNLVFRLTARDNHASPSAGGVAYDSITFSVSGTAGPFLVTAPNTAVTWQGLSQQTVTWDVASTNIAPVNCANVNIDLSTDGGYTYPTEILHGTPNDGSQAVTVPNVASTTARVRVSCASSIFFDISNANFTIEPGTAAPHLEIGKSAVTAGDVVTYTIAVSNTGTGPAAATITDTFAAELANPVCNDVAGDLHATTNIPAGDEAVYTCQATLDADIQVLITQTVDQPQVIPGTTVTFTIEVANPNAAITLTNVTVTAPALSGCAPALGTPITLGPGESQIYVCANMAVSHSLTSTAMVNAEVSVSNVATASATDDPQGVIASPVVTNALKRTAQDSTSVEVGYPYHLYLPLVLQNSGPSAR